MKEDMRVKRTKKMIKEAFLKLLEKNTLEQITISEITAFAMCNRNTFYLHFEDKYDLMNKLCNHALDRLHKAIQETYEKHKNSSEELYISISKACLDTMEEDIDFYRVVLGKNRYPLFTDLYCQEMLSHIVTNINIGKQNEKSKKIEIEFATNGVLGIHKYWLLHQDEYSKEDLLDISKNLVIGLGKIIYEDKAYPTFETNRERIWINKN